MAGTGSAGCCDVWAAARQPHAGVVLRRSGCELRGRLDQRAVVGMHVRHGCRLQLRQLGLQRQSSTGPRGFVKGRHDGRDGVRGVDVEVEQRGRVQAECWCRGGRAHAGGTGAACCCDVWAAARQSDAGVVLRCCRQGEQHGRLDERAVVGIHVCDCCGVQLRELALQRGRACGPRGCVFDGHDGRDCVRGVDVEVEQRG